MVEWSGRHDRCLLRRPWEHGGLQHISPYCQSGKAGFDQDGALVRFFAHHLRGDENGVGEEPRVRYFTIGAERWRASDVWPPPDAEARRYYLAEGRQLSREAPTHEDALDSYRVDVNVGTGRRSRWASLLGLIVPVGYSRRASAGRRMLVYRTPVLDEPVTVAGHPIVHLQVSVDAEDAQVFVYLEDEDQNGHVEYVTEGQLRALHRKTADDPPYDSVVPYNSYRRADAAPLSPGEVALLSFDLLPTAWRFDRGHRLRIAIAGADADHFRALPTTPSFAIHRSKRWSSYLELPTVAG